MEKNPVDWIADTSWTDIYLNIAGMSNLDAFKGFKEDFLKRPEAFRHIYDSNKAHEE
jgi:dynein heavy chain